VFSSPLRLGLRLYCNRRTSVKEMLDVWPPFPIEIRSSGLGDNMMAALEHQDRICEINLDLTYPECERLATVMQKPFPALTSLRLRSALFEHVPVLPDTFLGISAPRLRSLFWEGLAFPKLPQLILSFNDLSKLYLQSIPDHGYISPDAMVTGLSALTRLTYLCFDFDFEEIVAFRPRPPLTRVLLPALTEFEFRGVNEYWEDLLARIDVPQLETLTVIFKQHALDIRPTISRSRMLGLFDYAEVTFSLFEVDIQLYQPEETDPSLLLGVVEEVLGRQVSSIAQMCIQALSLLSSVTELCIQSDGVISPSDLLDNFVWLELFHSFTAVRTLHLWVIMQPCIVSSLRKNIAIGESVTEVLLELHDLYLHHSYRRNSVEEQAIELFIATRQLYGHPVTAHYPPYSDSD
jgi:hypothetical protein